MGIDTSKVLSEVSSLLSIPEHQVKLSYLEDINEQSLDLEIRRYPRRDTRAWPVGKTVSKEVFEILVEAFNLAGDGGIYPFTEEQEQLVRSEIENGD